MYIDLNTIKKHLNIDTEFTEDDDYLMMLEGVAEISVEKHIDKSLTELVDGEGNLPSPLKQAMLLYIGNMYLSRESVTFGNAVEIPLSYNYLLDLYKDYAKKEDVGGIFG
jgi:hypothetical protein